MRTLSTLTVLLLMGCAGARTSGPVSLVIRPREVPGYGYRYEGPMAGPYDSFTEMAQTACERMAAQPPSPSGTRAPGYCALIYDWPTDSRKWAFCHISPMTADASTGDRSCPLPEDPVFPDDTSELRLGGISRGPKDTQAGLEGWWRPTLFLNQRTGETWDFDMMAFALDASGRCVAYSYIAYSRSLFALHDGHWVPIGTVYNREGIVQALKPVE